ncbi:hypothetical protein G7085_12875 [Tessaracoccus sp. HDW20]|uniref:hypothetical protein n=1 Tax=Tessaracoccus coleopterorum TaxID=2714950 RepID=UPI0018D2AE57|nr:hypothetical protein [Tessaracoccus coleopterorum]NHB85218.1 hypothetical protein [Tessaracoccus coleopterorum]
MDRSTVLDFIRRLGLAPTEVTKLTITTDSMMVERCIPLGPVEVDITEVKPPGVGPLTCPTVATPPGPPSTSSTATRW